MLVAQKPCYFLSKVVCMSIPVCTTFSLVQVLRTMHVDVRINFNVFVCCTAKEVTVKLSYSLSENASSTTDTLFSIKKIACMEVQPHISDITTTSQDCECRCGN